MACALYLNFVPKYVTSRSKTRKGILFDLIMFSTIPIFFLIADGSFSRLLDMTILDFSHNFLMDIEENVLVGMLLHNVKQHNVNVT